MIVLNNLNIYLLEIPSLKVRWFKVLKMDIPFTLLEYIISIQMPTMDI